MASLTIQRVAGAALLFLLAACASQPDYTTSYQPPYLATGPQYPKQPSAPPLYVWIQKTEQQALADGVSAATVHAALDGFTPNPKVVELDRKQPETTITFAAYRHNTVTSARISRGADLMHRYAEFLTASEIRTGVPPQIVMALWAIESSYGQNMGSYDTVNSLATLAFEGRRADFFRGELFAALHILDREHLSPGDLRGSWAGAMGQCQFMPSTYLKYAVDGDGDGRVDIWNDPVDVQASIANYLASEGWHRGQSWGREVDASGSSVDASQIGLGVTRPVDEWAQQGVVGLDGQPLGNLGAQASLLQPDGPTGASFLAYDNIRSIMRWNHSTYFALSVGLLADGIKHN